MTEQIEKQHDDYEVQLHKNFKPGDVVTNGSCVGVVIWNQNEQMELPYWKGYMCVQFTIGYIGESIVRRDDYSKVSEFFATKYKVEMTLCEITEIKKILSSVSNNPIISFFLETISKIN
jgi:hypothetical protein